MVAVHPASGISCSGIRHQAPGISCSGKIVKKIVKNIFLKPRENPEKVRENPGKLEEKSMYIFGEVGKVFDGAGFAGFSDVFEK